MPFDSYTGGFRDRTGGLLWIAISVGNARAVMLDPMLSRRYAFGRPLDALRTPVPLRTAAAAIDLP